MATPGADAVIAVYLDKSGVELCREVLTDQAKARELQAPDPNFLDPYRVMTVEISCLPKDLPVFAEELAKPDRLGPPEVDGNTIEWDYALQNATDGRCLRYVFDTNFRVPLEVFAQVIKSLTKQDPTRCQTVKMLVCGGCIWPCRPKTCNGKASCGYAAGCPCP